MFSTMPWIGDGTTITEMLGGMGERSAPLQKRRLGSGVAFELRFVMRVVTYYGGYVYPASLATSR